MTPSVKTKVIEIGHCEDCCHLAPLDPITRDGYCCQVGKSIKAGDLKKDDCIPDWCPLEDKPQGPEGE